VGHLTVVMLIISTSVVAHGADRCPTTAPPMPAFTPPAAYSEAPFGADAFLLGTSDLWVAVERSPWYGLRV
jgi:hypothetical protein